MSIPAPTPDEIASLLQVEHLLDQRWPETKLEPSTARIAALMELLGSPQLGYPCIHIVGSTSAVCGWNASSTSLIARCASGVRRSPIRSVRMASGINSV